MHHTELAITAAISEIDGGRTDYLPSPPGVLLRERVVSAIENIPFYRKLYMPFGPVPEGDAFSGWFARLPVVSKSILQAVPEAELLNPIYDRAQLVRRPTSGSSGVPFVLYLDNRLVTFRKWRFRRPHQLLTRSSSARLAFIFPWDFVAKTPREERREGSTSIPLGERNLETRTELHHMKQQKQTFTALPKTEKRAADDSFSGASVPLALDRPVTINSLLPPAQIFELINELEPVSLVGFASVLAALARWLLKEQATVPSVKHVWTTSELLSPDGADAIRAAMRCEPLVTYASNEFGFMAWQGEKDAPLSFESDRLHLESFDRREPGPTARGELSRMIVTDLLNDTMPLIRYDIGDCARVHEPIRVNDRLYCATISDLQGKEADLIEPPDGRTITTFQVLGAIKDLLPDAQYRIICLSSVRYVLQYRPGVDFVPSNLAGVVAELGRILGDGVEILLQETADIEREASGKLRPIVNLSKMAPLKQREFAKKAGILSFLSIDETGAVRAIVEGVVAKVLPASIENRKVDDSMELYADLGMNSIHFHQLLSLLESEIGRQIDDEALLDASLITLGDLVSFVHKQITG